LKRRRKKEALVSPKLRSKMSKKLNETQLIAAHLLGAGHKPKDIAKKLDVREETISRWKSNDAFYDVMRMANFENRIEKLERVIKGEGVSSMITLGTLSALAVCIVALVKLR